MKVINDIFAILYSCIAVVAFHPPTAFLEALPVFPFKRDCSPTTLLELECLVSSPSTHSCRHSSGLFLSISITTLPISVLVNHLWVWLHLTQTRQDRECSSIWIPCVHSQWNCNLQSNINNNLLALVPIPAGHRHERIWLSDGRLHNHSNNHNMYKLHSNNNKTRQKEVLITELTTI